jgi:hypothetical protein
MPRNDETQEYELIFHTKTDKHEYVGVVLKGVKPSVANPI